MAVYMLFLKHETFDEALLADYVAKGLPTFERSEGTALAFNGEHTVLEGDPLDGIVVLRFPSKDDAMQWFDSPEYQEAAKIRKQAARFSVMIVEGLEEQ
ncbi:DUF1330 domain-containing protein [Sphingobium sp. BHU LFT2]|uniref:DUF1330 domain-containing protein n=1 Tax=Sphingobium sp. BHU LFT2 TaxID=2807634 RepID=UPI001BEBC6D7|nr:DUF1330 domain-containing protein [Sphingobium sp. BHU LFT2]MBT2246272.1 DUF1330 domain-containing protein [Sphingobium sp. BHU LFT2]